MRVADVMTTDVLTTTPQTPIREVARMLAERGISGLPVVEDGRVVGVISEADVLAKARRDPGAPSALERLLHRDGRDDKHDAHVAGEAMTAPPITVETYCSVATAASRMIEHNINRLPVLQRGRLVGIVSRADIVRAFARTDEEILADAREQVELQQALNGDDESIAVALDPDEGDLVLTGAVRRRADAESLQSLVRTIPGVVGVRSELTWREED